MASESPWMCNECGASVGVVDAAILENLVARIPMGLFNEAGERENT